MHIVFLKSINNQALLFPPIAHLHAFELDKQGTQSVPIDLIISIFIGAIMTLQIKLDMENPLLPRYTVGVVTRDTMLLEFSSTILCLILAGKVGSTSRYCRL